MICPNCRQYYDAVENLPGEWNNPTDEWCPKCISDRFESDMQQHRNKRIIFHGELVSIGKIDFECDGYYMPNSNVLNELYVKVNGTDLYGQLDCVVQERIEKELIRRMESRAIIGRCKKIETELADSDDPATLRLERSDLDSQLEALEAKHV